MALNLSLPKRRLLVRTMETPRGTYVLLTDEKGTPLPQQVATKVECGSDEVTQVTVTFNVDGDDIRQVSDNMSDSDE